MSIRAMSSPTRRLGLIRALILILPAVFLPAPSAAPAQPPVWTGPAFLPGDDTLAPSGSYEEAPALARGADGYLAVWADGRTNYASPPPFTESQSARDIYAARLDANGNLIDTIPIAVNQEYGYQRSPQVAWNGQSWLVVWESQAQTQTYYAAGVYAARVSPGGVPLDPTPIRVVQYQSSSSLMFSVTSNGSDWLVVAEGTSVNENDLVGRRIRADGTLIDATPVILVPAAYYLYSSISVHYAGGEYLLAYDNLSDDRARRYGLDLSFLGTYTIPGLLLQSNGERYYLAWSSPTGILLGSPMTKEGVLTYPNGIQLATTSGISETDLAWDGTRWWVSVRHATQGILLRRVAEDGTPIDANGIPLDPPAAPSTRNHRTEGGPNGGVAVLWQDMRAGGSFPYDIYAASMSAAGVPSAEAPISLSAPAQIDADLTAGGNGFLLTFVSAISGSRRIMAQRLGPAGEPLDLEPVELGDGLYAGSPAVAWNGSVYLVVWSNGATVLSRRLGADGTVLDPAPIEVMPGITPDVAGLGDMFVVVCTHITFNNPHWRVPFSRRVSATTGQPLDPDPRVLGQIFAQHPRVITCQNRWVAFWQRNFSHDNPQAALSGAFIETDGSSSQEFGYPTYIGAGFTPDLAFSGSVVLVAMRSNSEGSINNDIRGLRMLPDGTFPDGTASFVISGATDEQFHPAVTWDGTQFIVAWDDKRNAVTFFDDRTDIYGARVEENGTVLDPSGFPVAADPGPEQLPALATAGGNTLLAAAIFRSGAPYASYRLGLFLNAASAAVEQPEPVPTPAFDWGLVANPWRPGGAIRFEVGAAVRAPISLAVYDVLGRKVGTLIAAEAPSAGSREITWDGRNASGRRLERGTYFLHLSAGTLTATRKITLLE